MQSIQSYLELGKLDIANKGFWFGDVFVGLDSLMNSDDRELMLEYLVCLVENDSFVLGVLTENQVNRKDYS